MNYSVEFLTEFADRLAELDAEYKKTIAQHDELYNNLKTYSENFRKEALGAAAENGKRLCGDSQAEVKSLRTSEENSVQAFLGTHSEDFEMLGKCARLQALLTNAEKRVRNPAEYERFKTAKKFEFTLTPNGIVDNESRLLDLMYDAEMALRGKSTADKKEKCSKLFCYCSTARSVLDEHIRMLRKGIFDDKKNMAAECAEFQRRTDAKLAGCGEDTKKYFSESAEMLQQKADELSAYIAKMRAQLEDDLAKKLDALQEGFLEAFPVMEMSQEYDRIYRSEPNYDEYSCTDEIPTSICIGKLEYDIGQSGFSDFTMTMLDRYYSFMFNGAKLIIPYCAAFDGAVNHFFKYDGNASDNIRVLANGIAMRLFMMMQLGKMNFTFYDPVALGGSFSDFSGLVNIDDRSADLINGKIWTSSEDIEDKLHVLAEHISGITQRCLRGRVNNICEYNKEAGFNAEPYQVIMIMDYPAALSDEALKLIEQIAQSGSRCGVFILLFGSTNQRRQLKNFSLTLAESLESYFPLMKYDNTKEEFLAVIPDRTYRFVWRPAEAIPEDYKETIYNTLRAGIKSMARVVIDVDRVKDAEVSDTTAGGIKVPIGIFDANSIQYLTLGSGGSGCHHALIAGIAGMGKSSLLHTVIIQCLKQYSPDELEIYLVDFKRGVEFKLYADYRLPHFKVIAVESEREFGYNVLKAIDREQKVRADIFKNFRGGGHIEKIGEYREKGGKMPRILVIMDEFHELFTDDDEISKESSVLMERIVRQGRAFGVHLILSSQSYANVKGLDKAVYDQMTVRMVMKCSSDDANMLLENGSGMVDLISTDDAGKVIYNSEAGSKAASNMFRAVYIQPDSRGEMLREISENYSDYPGDGTRVLLSNIEDSVFCKFNRFADENYVDDNRQIIVGESLDIKGRMNMNFTKAPRSNMMLIGDNNDKARNLFSFSMISMCIDKWLKNDRTAPEKPFIRLMNFKPLIDDYFVDVPKMIAELLPQYIEYVDCADADAVGKCVEELYGLCNEDSGEENYLLVFGYQRAEALRSEVKRSVGGEERSPLEMMDEIIRNGSANGLHTMMWQDRYSNFAESFLELIPYFNMRVAFEMPKEALLAFVMSDNTDAIDENSAIFYNSMSDNQTFRVYQTPHLDWVEALCHKLWFN